jgi:hypothetical protein
MFGLSMFAAGADRGHGWRTRRSTMVVAIVGALVAGIAAGCALELERDVSCGDGWWDPEYEECDPRDPSSFRDACRDQGWKIDAACDPKTCEILATEEACTVCGDGVASGAEACDGEDLRGSSCSAGVGTPTCNSDCTLDHSLCPPVCGDGIIGGVEECEPGASCASDDDCRPGTVCYPGFGQCVAIGAMSFGPTLACAAYESQAVGIDKAYAKGTIKPCTAACLFGRNDCGFCGDGQLDPGYVDVVYPSGEFEDFPLAEKCDREQLSDEIDLQAHCEQQCIVDGPPNDDVVVLCDFECNENCSGLAPPIDIVAPTPEAFGCCLDKGSPCPNFGTEGVPELPCCSWFKKPEWFAQKHCVNKNTDDPPVPQVCP